MNTKKAAKSGDITGVSGTNLSSSKTGDILGTICDRFGNEVHDSVIMKEATHTPGSQFNLFSITKYMQQGWVPGGNSDAFWIEKDDKKLYLILKFQHQRERCFACIFRGRLK